jgi:hypothetical protein
MLAAHAAVTLTKRNLFAGKAYAGATLEISDRGKGFGKEQTRCGGDDKRVRFYPVTRH